MKFLLGLLVSYLIGSFPTAYLVGKLVRGIDIRKEGSGNVGATNVFRVVGKGWGIGVLAIDIFKGFLVVFFLPRYFSASGLMPFFQALLFGLAAIAGHTWTIWLQFRGGKGVATSAGVFLALVPYAAIGAFVVWIAVFLWKRYVSLASLAMALGLPFWVVGFYRTAEFFWILFPVTIGLAAFIFYTHRENISRLREGREKKLI